MPVPINEWNDAEIKVGAKFRRKKHYNHNRDCDDDNDSGIPVRSAKIGSPFCVLYFIFIDIWTLNFIVNNSHDTDVRASMNARINYLKVVGARFFDWIMKQTDDESSSIIFPLTYAGNYEPISVALRSKKKDQPMCALTAPELDAMRDQIARQINE
jgi:hypothetical protein